MASEPADARSETDRAGDLAAVLTEVGPRLRALRNERGETLADVSAATGISQSTLSRLESGGRKPTLELLLPLATMYEVPLDRLVGTPADDDPRVRPNAFVRNGITFLPLTRQAGGLQAYKQIMPAGYGSATEPDQRTHEGYEWLYVLSGRLRLRLGPHDLTLTAGEVAEFDTRTPHAWSNPHTVPVEFLSLYGHQGERMHVRARPKTGTTT